jgi:SAM-dependent methyltransferase
VLTTKAAAALLAAAATPGGLRALVQSLGFSRSVRAERALAEQLGVADALASAHLGERASGSGLLRVLAGHVSGDRPLRDVLALCATRLQQVTPHVLWLVVIVARDGREAALCTWTPGETRMRRATLLFEPSRVRDSDAETFSALAAAATGEDSLVQLRWHEILGREAMSVRFYRALERAVVSLGEGATGRAPGEVRRELALVNVSRLLFLSFLQGRGWLDGHADFLVAHCDAAAGRGPGIHRGVLDPLFFGTLNAPASRRAARARAFGRIPFLNGGLFARTPLEREYPTLRFRDEELAALFDEVLTRFRFTTHEERTDGAEAAIDPEMLGRAFESLMASRDRRESGAFYTPHALVARCTDAALSEHLRVRGVPEATRDLVQAGRPLLGSDTGAIQAALGGLRVLDPACGTGAFLVHILDRLTDLHLATGDPRSRPALKRAILTHTVFGVDINPLAVWLCELRLWLSCIADLMVDDPMDVPPLPNLDRNVRVGDALDGGWWFDDGRNSRGSAIARLRDRYARATGHRKVTVLRTLDREERNAAIRALEQRLSGISEERWSLLTVSRGRDLFGGRRGSIAGERERRALLQRLARNLRSHLRSLRRGGALPFRFASHFHDAMQAGGFDLIIGNPPWVRLHRIPPERREQLKQTFRVYRDAAWQQGTARSGAGAGFATQVDLAALFVEQSSGLLRPGGVLGLLLPMKLWRSLAGGGVRRLLAADHALCAVEDWSAAPAAFDAAVYPSLVVAQRAGATAVPPTIQIAVHKRRLAVSWRTASADLSFDDSPGAPWIVLPPDARRAFDRLLRAGTPLESTSFGAPQLGVKCGCNDAFLVEAAGLDVGQTTVRTVRGNVRVESVCLRPVLRGEHVTRWLAPPHHEWIVWTHGSDGRPLATLPELTARWLSRWKRQLCARSDARPTTPWWSLFRVDGARNDRPRVVWADLSRGPRAAVLPMDAPAVPLNTCYVMSCRDDVDAATLVTLLNSPLVEAWLAAIAEPARGSFKRYLGWTIACLPLPVRWSRARDILSPLGARAVAGDPPADADLMEAACDAYDLPRRALAPLVEWTWQ